MTVAQIAGFFIALLLMAVGVIGSFIPVLPGAALILGTAVVHKLCFGEAGASWLVLSILLAFTFFSFLLDYVATLYGTKRMGATWRGVVGAVLGCIVGVFFGLPGIVIGPFLGALLGELAGGREWQQAAQAGLGALLGLFAGAVGKLVCCMAMTALFAVNVLVRAWK
jgi:uncharacterized protein YqgC (DUF456 family)